MRSADAMAMKDAMWVVWMVASMAVYSAVCLAYSTVDEMGGRWVDRMVGGMVAKLVAK